MWCTVVENRKWSRSLFHSMHICIALYYHPGFTYHFIVQSQKEGFFVSDGNCTAVVNACFLYDMSPTFNLHCTVQEEETKRRDFRRECVFSIDPATAKVSPAVIRTNHSIIRTSIIRKENMMNSILSWLCVHVLSIGPWWCSTCEETRQRWDINKPEMCTFHLYVLELCILVYVLY